ncbi:MAG: sugar phosphate nucleotidyltransferase [Candidatus Woykebacteria bacterium]
MKICVFCGGVGTRMWPLSRKKLPKQFQPLIGNKSPFQFMIGMLSKGFKLEDIYVVSGKEYEDLVKNQVPALPSSNIILEPEMRDTLAAVGLAASILEKKFPGETMATIWGADHVVKNEKEFIKALKAAENLAKDKPVIVKIDVRPSSPNVHLGYIKIGKKIGETSGFEIHEFIKHIEKPPLTKAAEFLKKGYYLWNTGYLVWKISTIMNLYEKHTPGVFRIIKKIQKEFDNGGSDISNDFNKIPKISIDYGLFEKLKKGDQLVLLSDLGWSDIGAWDALKEALTKGNRENLINVSHEIIDTENSFIKVKDKNKFVATVGLKDMIVIDDGDVLLICPKDRTSEIKNIVEKLKMGKKEKYL